MTADVLGHRVDHDVGAVRDRPAQVGRRHGVVDDQRNARGVRDLGNRLQVADHAVRVGCAFDENPLGLLPDRLLKFLGLGGVDEAYVPVELGEGLAELGNRAAVQLGRRDDLVARIHEVKTRHELRGVAARDRAGGGAALECGDALLQHRDGRVGDARVDVAEALQVEQGCRMVGIVEHVGGGLIDRRRARAGGRIRRGAGVNRQRLEAVVLILLAHVFTLRCPGSPPTPGEPRTYRRPWVLANASWPARPLPGMVAGRLSDQLGLGRVAAPARAFSNCLIARSNLSRHPGLQKPTTWPS